MAEMVHSLILFRFKSDVLLYVKVFSIKSWFDSCGAETVVFFANRTKMYGAFFVYAKSLWKNMSEIFWIVSDIFLNILDIIFFTSGRCVPMLRECIVAFNTFSAQSVLESSACFRANVEWLFWQFYSLYSTKIFYICTYALLCANIVSFPFA